MLISSLSLRLTYTVEQLHSCLVQEFACSDSRPFLISTSPHELPAVGFFVEQKQLVAQKIHIEENEDRDTGLEQRHYKEDPDCVMAKVPLGDLDLYDGTFISLESKDIR